MTDLLSTRAIVGGIGGVLTAIAAYNVTREHSTLSNPLIGICAGTLAVIGLAALPEGFCQIILMGYVALAITLMILGLLLAFGWMSNWRKAWIRRRRIVPSTARFNEGRDLLACGEGEHETQSPTPDEPGSRRCGQKAAPPLPRAGYALRAAKGSGRGSLKQEDRGQRRDGTPS